MSRDADGGETAAATAVEYLRRFPKLAYSSEWSTKAYRDFVYEPAIQRYLYSRSYGRREELIEQLLDDADKFIYVTQCDRAREIYAGFDTSELRSYESSVLEVVYALTLEQGPSVLASDSFLARKVSELTGVDPAPKQRAGRAVAKLVRLGFLEVLDPGNASWVCHQRRSRKIALNGNY